MNNNTAIIKLLQLCCTWDRAHCIKYVFGTTENDDDLKVKTCCYKTLQMK